MAANGEITRRRTVTRLMIWTPHYGESHSTPAPIPEPSNPGIGHNRLAGDACECDSCKGRTQTKKK